MNPVPPSKRKTPPAAPRKKADPERDGFHLLLGVLIARIRAQHGLTQIGLAAALEISPGTLSRIERGRLLPSAWLLHTLRGLEPRLLLLLDQALIKAPVLFDQMGPRGGLSVGSWWALPMPIRKGLAQLVIDRVLREAPRPDPIP